MQNVIVYVEHKAGQTRKVTFELATQACKLAGDLGGKAYAVVLGAGAASLAEQLQKYPLDGIYVTEDGDVDKFFLDPIVDYVEAVAKSTGPALILVPNTMLGRDVAGRVAARLNGGLTSDVTDFTIESSKIVSIAPKLQGSTITGCAFKNTEYGVVTVRPNAFEAQTGGGSAQVTALEKPAGKSYAVVIAR